jgi:thymidylate synthase
MVLYYIWCIKFNRLITGFYDARIGEQIFGFSDQDEDESGGTITILARSQIGDLTDMLKTFPQMTYNEYMYERSIAQIQFMATDNTHVKYLKDKDKRIWENYKEIIKSQTMLENLFASHRKIKNND